MVLIAWGRTSGTGGAGHAAEIPFPVPSTPGFSWTSFGGQWANGSGFAATQSGAEIIYYIPNAPSMSVSTTVTASTTGSGNAMSLRTEFTLYEFSGVATSAMVDVSNSVPFSTGNPQGGTLSTAQSDLIIATYSGIAGSNTTAGSGYILGIDATVPVLGQMQYKTNASVGSNPTSFGGGSVQYSGVAIAFKPAPIVAGTGIQTKFEGQTLITGSMGTEPIQPISQIGDFVASLPINWVNPHQCDPPGGTFTEGDITLGTLTMAGLQTAVNAWVGGWYRIKIPAGTNIHSSSYTTHPDGTKYLLLLPSVSNPLGCMVIESTTPNTTMTMLCSHGLPLPGQGTRNPGCTNDIAKLWTFTADTTTISGNVGVYQPFGSSHIVIRDGEFTIAKGAYQSASGVKVNVIIQMEGNSSGLERNYIHGYNPGDSGQPTGACSGWTFTGTVNTSGSTVTWVSGKRFGMTFADATHSPGYPQATITINTVPYTISSHDPAVTDTTLTLSTSAGTQTGVAYTITNPPTVYANGCGDDMRSILMNCDDCWTQWNYFEKIHWYANESHAISSGFSLGPIQIAHNWIEAGSSGYFSGGGPVDERGGPANDIVIRGNYIGRDLGWRALVAESGKSPHPPFGCGPIDQVSAHDNCPMNWAVKNLLELKLGHRVLIDGNILDGNWSSGQSGYIVLETVRACSGGSTCGIYDATTGLPVTAIDNVRFSNNWVRNTPQVIQLSTRSLAPGDGGGMAQPVNNLDFINNLFSNINDDNQWGTPGPDLVQWAADGQKYIATLSRSGNIAHAVAAPMKLANYDPGTSNVGTFKTSIDVTSVVRSGTTVTINLKSLRHDPTIGGQVTVATASGWNGTFTITDVLNTNVNTRCTTDLRGAIVTAAVAVGPQPCVRNNGTFGDSLTYTDGQGAPGTLCSSQSTCDALNGGAGIQVTMDTLAYNITDMQVGDGVYVHNCTGGSSPSSYQVGSTAFTPAVGATNPAGLVVEYANIGANDSSGTVCTLENNAGLPHNATFQYNTVLTPGFVSIGSDGQAGQHFNNRFYHNIFATTSSGSNDVLTCITFGTEGTASFQCWDPTSFNFYDNVLQGRNSASWSVVPVAAALNSFPATVTCSGATATANCLGWTGYMNGTAFPTTSCPLANAPTDCPLMALPWSTNFDLSKIAPVATSFYQLQGSNLTTLQDAFTRTIYIAPVGSNVGTTGPFPD